MKEVLTLGSWRPQHLLGEALSEEESGHWPLELSLANVCGIIIVTLGS